MFSLLNNAGKAIIDRASFNSSLSEVNNWVSCACKLTSENCIN